MPPNEQHPTEQDEDEPAGRGGRHPAALPWAVAAVAVLVALSAILVPRLTGGDEMATGERSTAPTATRTVNPEYGDTRAFERRQAEDPTALGKTDAPVVMVSYSDYQCPYCGTFARSTEKQLISKYVESGVLRIEWRDFPYLGKESVAAARAARAAAAQGKFWQFHDGLFAEQFPPNSGRLDADYLIRIATDKGLDVKQFTKEMSSATMAKLVQHDFDEGMSTGVTGTPSFLVNGVPIIGAMPLAEFETTIERAAKAAQED